MADQHTPADNFEADSCLFADNGDFKTHALVSIAFSLKRIADALHYTGALNEGQKPESIYEAVSDIRYNTRGAP